MGELECIRDFDLILLSLDTDIIFNRDYKALSTPYLANIIGNFLSKINFTIREEETDELVRDARQIATPGVEGERTIKTRVYSSNGQEVDRQELSNEETLAP
ncbi:G5 domain-containing protein, partial [Streptococcus gordonii]|nr:G5 domain-containing protein [Streptococcus gordonii]